MNICVKSGVLSCRFGDRAQSLGAEKEKGKKNIYI